MDSAAIFSADHYAQFPNYPQMELDYMHFLSKGNKSQGGHSQGDNWSARVAALEDLVKKMSLRIEELETHIKRLGQVFPSDLPKDAKPVKKPAAKEAAPKEEQDDDFDLFGDDDEEVKPMPVIAKPKKEAPVAKSMIVLDVKPWDDTTNMEEMEAKVREITAEGLVWGSAKLVPLAYGIKKLQIACVVEDDKVGCDFLEENITALDDYVQSVDIASFNKL